MASHTCVYTVIANNICVNGQAKKYMSNKQPSEADQIAIFRETCRWCDLRPFIYALNFSRVAKYPDIPFRDFICNCLIAFLGNKLLASHGLLF